MIEARLAADSPDLNRLLRGCPRGSRKRWCWFGMALGAALMGLEFLTPVMITVGFLIFSTAAVALVGPVLLAPHPPSSPRP